MQFGVGVKIVWTVRQMLEKEIVEGFQLLVMANSRLWLCLEGLERYRMGSLEDRRSRN